MRTKNQHITKCKSRNIYGSSRLETTKDTLNMFVPEILPSYGILGNRQYELSNHLGNVLTVINDVKYPLSDDNTTISGYEVGINGISDYSPFGAPLDGRTVGELGKYGFQGQENDDEIKGEGNSVNSTFRMHDPRLGRFLSIDPLVWKYPFYSSYQFSSNSPIFTVELEGLESSYLINYTEKNSITLTKNENNQFEIDMTEADQLDQQYRENIQGANFSRPHDATPAPGTRIQAISSGSKDVHAWTIIIPSNATVTTDDEIPPPTIIVDKEIPNSVVPPMTGEKPITSSPPLKNKLSEKTKTKKTPSINSLIKLNNEFSGASIFISNTLSNGKIDWNITTDSNIPGSIGDIMKDYSNMDLSKVKINVQITVGRANKRENYFPQKGEVFSRMARHQLINSGFSDSNISISTNENSKQSGPSATFNIK